MCPHVPTGAVLLDENLKELNLTSPTLVGPRAFARLQRALWSGKARGTGRVPRMLVPAERLPACLATYLHG